MRKFKLEIEIENAAFGETPCESATEIARILRDAARKIEEGADSGSLADANGNKVGAFGVVDDRAFSGSV